MYRGISELKFARHKDTRKRAPVALSYDAPVSSADRSRSTRQATAALRAMFVFIEARL